MIVAVGFAPLRAAATEFRRLDVDGVIVDVRCSAPTGTVEVVTHDGIAHFVEQYSDADSGTDDLPLLPILGLAKQVDPSSGGSVTTRVDEISPRELNSVSPDASVVITAGHTGPVMAYVRTEAGDYTVRRVSIRGSEVRSVAWMRPSTAIVGAWSGSYLMDFSNLSEEVAISSLNLRGEWVVAGPGGLPFWVFSRNDMTLLASMFIGAEGGPRHKYTVPLPVNSIVVAVKVLDGHPLVLTTNGVMAAGHRDSLELDLPTAISSTSDVTPRHFCGFRSGRTLNLYIVVGGSTTGGWTYSLTKVEAELRAIPRFFRRWVD